MKRANYHTHTIRCGHAVGTEEEYVLAAIEAGMEELGFADHSPQPYKDGFVSGIRMPVDGVEEYVEKLLALREKYKDRIAIKIGFEAEYYEDIFEDLITTLKAYPIDYLILGQHYVGPERMYDYVGVAFDNEEKLAGYVDEVLAGLATGYFSFLAHPDVIRFTGDAQVYRKHMLRLCQGCKQMDTPMEINCLGMAENRHYPREEFWRIAAQVGNRVVIGYDAHKPEALKDEQSYAACVEFARRLGLKPEEEFRITGRL